jgi:hypothetical protein
MKDIGCDTSKARWIAPATSSFVSKDNSAKTGGSMIKKPDKLPPTTDEIEVLRRMLHTPPKPHKPKAKPTPTKRRQAKP